jgi:PAS domain S-box-containing protein
MMVAQGEAGWERLFWLVFERTSNPVLLLDEQRVLVDVNAAAAELLGRDRKELIGSSVIDSIRPSERERAGREWQEFLRSEEYSGARDLIRPDGSEVQVDFAARMAPVGGRRLAIYVVMVRGDSAVVERGSVAELPLTGREREVVTLIALGNDTAEIARELEISPETVRTHVRNAMAKLDVHSRAQLVAVVLGAKQALHSGRIEAEGRPSP